MNLKDSSDNVYIFDSIGCVELGDIFFEVLESPNEYFMVWCHEDGEPKSWEDLMEKKVAMIDYRNGTRSVELSHPNNQDVVDKIWEELQV